MHSSPSSPYPAATEESRPVPRLFPELYVKANALQRTVNIRALELLQPSFRDKPDADQQQFMDLGCGTGDFTLRELLPRCQPCRRIVAMDVAKEMVRYARENYPHPQIEYEVYDIADDALGLVKSYGKFDRVYSFFVLHWVKDQVTAFGHISDLMTSGGECLLTIVARWTGYEIWRRIVRMDRWKSYAQPKEGRTCRLVSRDSEMSKAWYPGAKSLTAGWLANTFIGYLLSGWRASSTLPPKMGAGGQDAALLAVWIGADVLWIRWVV
ncbi:hypothetical protein HPB47_003234 [Ixodes persulcatus]|uniref:Uncharacterized protein n=1 Tax=Ixodes persulcatus TaxID=34615 RepID=A0AC60PIY5_IXOPE|nr:hypothetical protein HPB47_003234 [Ixodes persulcatus]